MIDQLERQLDSFDAAQRRQALEALLGAVAAGQVALPAPGNDINLHAHTFYSYNAYGYSPSKFAWLARKAGLGMAGVVDFDVLDALEEFTHARRLLGLKGCVSLESRVFVPEFATRVINSPGEPGIAYHMGVGFTRSGQHPFLTATRAAAEQRTREIVRRVNPFLQPVALDYARDILPLTPAGNATERHLCQAYERKAAQVFPDPGARAAFWQSKLGEAPPEGGKLQNLIRAKTMKKGGPGYVPPGQGSFPLMADMNRFVLESDAIPALTWLDGTSEGEQSLEELVTVAMAHGAAAVNLIPDRNYTPGLVDQKLSNLQAVVAMAERHHLPILVGTEMNAPGNKFVDAFGTAELAPLLPVFLRGAWIFYAHTVLQREAGLGYLGAWATRCLPERAVRNAFFEQAGRAIRPDCEARLTGLSPTMTPDQVLARIGQL